MSPGVPPELRSSRAAGVPVIGEVERHSGGKGRVIRRHWNQGEVDDHGAVGRMLERAVAVGGNIGAALSQGLDR